MKKKVPESLVRRSASSYPSGNITSKETIICTYEKDTFYLSPLYPLISTIWDMNKMGKIRIKIEIA